MLQQGIVYFARYEIKRHIATGSRSEIYSAYDRKTSRYVIIKSITAKPLTSSQSVNAIFSAAKKITGNVTQNIVPVVDCCAMGGYLCVITQDISGITLKTYCEKKGKLNVKDAIAIAIKCCMGLQVLLNHNVLVGNHFYHSYIDPKDVIVSTEGKIFLNNMFMPMIIDGTNPEKNSWCYYTYPSKIQTPSNIE